MKTMKICCALLNSIWYIYLSTDNVLNMIKILFLQKFDVFCASLTNDIVSIDQLGPDIPMSTSEQAHWPLLMHSGSERETSLVGGPGA